MISGKVMLPLAAILWVKSHCITGSITLHKMQVYAFFLCKNILLKSYVKKDILAVILISVWCGTIKELELL